MELIDGRFQNTSGIGVLTLNTNGTYTGDRVWFNWSKPVFVRLEENGCVELHQQGVYNRISETDSPLDMPVWKIRE